MSSRSCDRCYKTRSKCTILEGQQACERCHRLKHICTWLRPIPQRGRKRKEAHLCNASSEPFIWVSNGDVNKADRSPLQECKQLQLRNPDLSSLYSDVTLSQPLLEQQLLATMWSPAHFAGTFVLGPNFLETLESGLKGSFDAAPRLLKEAYLSVASAFLEARGDSISRYDIKYHNIAIALRKLRTCSMTVPSQASIISALGLSVATFEILTQTASLHAVVEHTLSLMKPWHPLTVRDPAAECHLNCLILMDTVECLVKRKIPILKYQVMEGAIIDRAQGFCCTFLPLLYEVCQISHSVKTKQMTSIDSTTIWTDIEDRVQNWCPTIQPDFYQCFTGHEVTILCTQANIYRESTLLLIHRLKYHHGFEDETAALKSQYILSEFEHCFNVTKQYPLHTFFPFLVAAVEVIGQQERDNLRQAMFMGWNSVFDAFLGRLKHFIEFIWQRIDGGLDSNWLALAANFPGLVFLP